MLTRPLVILCRSAALATALLSGPGVVAASDEPLFASIEPPRGFQHLLEPQTSLVDVYFGGRFVLSSLATYTPDSLIFESPAQVVDSLPDLADRQLVATKLAGRLPINGERVCLGGRQPGCGELLPEIVGIIYDGSSFRVDLFVNPDHLLVRQPTLDRFLPASQSGLTLLQNFSATVAGSDDDNSENATTIASSTTVALRENRVVGITSYTDQDDLTVDRLFAQRDFRGAEYVGGLFRTTGRALTFAGEHDLGGVRVASSLRTRSDLAFAQGTPVTVFLAAGSRVDILKDGRLLSSAFYPAGNQVLDTSMLPDGAYDITVRVSEGGTQREETRFFSKTARIPPMDQPLTTFEAGRILERSTTDLFPESVDATLVRLGHSRRLTQGVGLDAGIAATEDERLFELGGFWLGSLPEGHFELQGSGFGDAEGDSGIAANGQMYLGRWYLGFDYRRVFKDSDTTAAASGEFRLIPEEISQRSVSTRLPLFGGSLGLSASYNRRGAGDKFESRSVTYTRTLFRTRRNLFRFSADISETDDNWVGLIGFSINSRLGDFSSDVTPRYRYDDRDGQGHGYQVDGFASWRRPEFYSGDLQVGVSGSSNNDQTNAGGTVEYDHRLARSRLTVNRQDFEGDNRTSWAGNIVTSMLTNGTALTVGAQNAANSAILVTLDGEVSGTEFDVLIDGQPRGYAPVGRTTPIHLSPFRTYEVRVRPRLHNFVAFDDRAEQVTLYPGNVVNLTWEVADIMVVVGRATDHQGRPISNARIEGIQGIARTDGNGYFQAEAKRTKEPLRLVFVKDEASCTVFASRFEQRRGVGFLDNLTCRMRPNKAEAISALSDGRDRERQRIRIHAGRNAGHNP